MEAQRRNPNQPVTDGLIGPADAVDLSCGSIRANWNCVNLHSWQNVEQLQSPSRMRPLSLSSTVGVASLASTRLEAHFVFHNHGVHDCSFPAFIIHNTFSVSPSSSRQASWQRCDSCSVLPDLCGELDYRFPLLGRRRNRRQTQSSLGCCE